MKDLHPREKRSERMSEKLTQLVADLKEGEALELVKSLLAEGEEPLTIMAAARDGMRLVGERFSAQTYFIPDLVYSGQILKQAAELVEPHLKSGAAEETRRGKVIIGTVAGDIHDIGKDMVVFMLDASGYEVIDLGIDVPAAKFVETARATGSKVIGLSGFLTLAFNSMKTTIEAIDEARLRDRVKIMIGGGQIDEQIVKYTGADAYGRDAQEAVTLADGWIGG
jgi:5-methyltetrahydrofolate--homocysteine methyltransferase